MTRRKPATAARPASKIVAIKNGRGEVTGHITLYWSRGLDRYVSIPE